MNSVAVLPSTYNGEKWLKEQLDSILNQRNVDVTLYIRDDGSRDETVSILKEYNQKYPNVVLWVEDNIGWGRSFITLLSRVKNHSYYAFADQDDVWLPDKLDRAVKKINTCSLSDPVLYYSAMTIINGNGEFIKEVQCYNPWVEKGGTNVLPACINNLCCGCVMVFNDNLRKLCIFTEYLDNPNISHDAYLGAVALCVGKVIYDKESFIQHRIHENNATVSMRKRNLKDLITHAVRAISGHKYFNCGKFIYDNYAQYCNDKERPLLKCMSTYKEKFQDKLTLLSSPSVCFVGSLGKKGTLGTILLKLTILMSNY